MKKTLSIIISLSCLLCVSCGNTYSEDTSSPNQSEPTITINSKATSDSQKENDEQTSSDEQTDTAVSENYHLIYLGYFDGEEYPYQTDITDEDKREKINALIAEINSAKDKYIYDKTGIPERGGSFGYSLTVDGVKYIISDLHDDPDGEYIYENLTIGDIDYIMPQDLIDELVMLLADEFPEQKSYHVIISGKGDPNDEQFNIDITDPERLEAIDNWLAEVNEICPDYRLEEGDYPQVGGTSGYILKTFNNHYDKMYFITTTRLDLSQYFNEEENKDYEHQKNFSNNFVSYQLPWEYIDEIEQLLIGE